MSLIADLVPKIRTAKDVDKEMSKTTCDQQSSHSHEKI